MFLIRRVWRTKPRQARAAASVALAMAASYEQNGQRHDVRVSFNGGTLPGERDLLFMAWTVASIESTYRPEREAPPGNSELAERLRELTTDTWIEFHELMTRDKALPLDG